MSFWLFIGSASLVSFLLCCGLILFGPRDAPDGDRKTQSRAVPTLGGVAIVGAIVQAMLGSIAFGDSAFEDYSRVLTMQAVWPFALLMLALFAIGLLDDLLTLSTRLKLALMAALCLAAPLFALSGGAVINFPGLVIPVPVVVTGLGCGLWIFVFANASNFMDGANGLSMGCLVIMCLALCWNVFEAANILWHEWPNDLLIFLLLTVSAVTGFLVLNLAGRIYAGDSGALTIGALFAIGAVLLLQFENWQGYQVWTPATLALPFLIDVLLTLIWRFRRGRNLLTAHLDHAYQLLRRAGWGHLPVAFLWWGLTAVCAVAAVMADQAGGNAPFFVFAALLLTGCAAWVWQRGVYGPRVEASLQSN